ncbi:class II lanthipeptide, LchA2/BrtA2 family [Staphylococcus epidermidis]
MFSKNFQRNEKMENTLKKVSSANDVNGGATPTITTSSATCGGIIVAASAAQCPTLACSSRCGKRNK